MVTGGGQYGGEVVDPGAGVSYPPPMIAILLGGLCFAVAVLWVALPLFGLSRGINRASQHMRENRQAHLEAIDRGAKAATEKIAQLDVVARWFHDLAAKLRAFGNRKL